MGRVLPRRGGVVAVVLVVLTSFLLLGPEARAVTRFRHFDLPEESGPGEITTGPDGNLWFTEHGIFGNRIGRITTVGAITEFPVPTANAIPDGITAGPDG